MRSCRQFSKALLFPNNIRAILQLRSGVEKLNYLPWVQNLSTINQRGSAHKRVPSHPRFCYFWLCQNGLPVNIGTKCWLDIPLCVKFYHLFNAYAHSWINVWRPKTMLLCGENLSKWFKNGVRRMNKLTQGLKYIHHFHGYQWKRKPAIDQQTIQWTNQSTKNQREIE